MTTQSAITRRRPNDYSHIEPLPSPPPREPDMQQFERIMDFATILKPHFTDRDDVLVSGGGYLRQDASGDLTGSLVPDCVVTFGIDPRATIARNGYVISEVGKPPDFVLEVASRSTGRRDYTVKRERYAEYGVQEYWRFDHTGGRYHDAPLAGDTLVGGAYRPLPIHRESDGLIWGYSEILGLDLCWENGEMRLRNPLTGEFLLTPEEMGSRADAQQSAREAAEARVRAAEARIADMEAELRRVRGE